MYQPVSYLKAGLSQCGIASHLFLISCCQDHYPRLVYASPRRELNPVLFCLPKFLLACPDSWQVQHHVVETLLDHLNFGSVVGDESQCRWELFVFEDAIDDFHFHFPSLPPADKTTTHPILELHKIPSRMRKSSTTFLYLQKP